MFTITTEAHGARSLGNERYEVLISGGAAVALFEKDTRRLLVTTDEVYLTPAARRHVESFVARVQPAEVEAVEQERISQGYRALRLVWP